MRVKLVTLGIFSGTGPEMNSGSRRRTPVIGSGTRQPAVQELPVVVAQRPPVVDEEEEEGCPVLVTHPIRAGGRCQDYRLETEARDRRLRDRVAGCVETKGHERSRRRGQADEGRRQTGDGRSQVCMALSLSLSLSLCPARTCVRRNELPILFRAASQCNNVCKVHGLTEIEGKLSIIMAYYQVRYYHQGRLPCCRSGSMARTALPSPLAQ